MSREERRKGEWLVVLSAENDDDDLVLQLKGGRDVGIPCGVF